MSDTAAAVAAPETPTAPAEAEKPAVTGQPVDDGKPKTVAELFKRLTTKQAQAKEAGAAAKPEGDAPTADAKPAAKGKAEPKGESKADDGPVRGPDGKFLPKDGVKPVEDEDTKRQKPPAKPKEAPAPDELPDAATKADDAVAERIDAKVEKLEDAGAKVPEQKANESDKQYELKLSRQLMENKRLQSELLKSQGEAKRAKDTDELLARIKGDEIDEEAFEKLTGRTLVDTVRGIAKGKEKGGLGFKAKSSLPPELAAAVAKVDAFEAKQREQAEAQERTASESRSQEVRKGEVATVKGWLDEKAEDLPFLTALDDAHEQLLDTFYADWLEASGGEKYSPLKKPDIEDVAKRMEARARKRFEPIMANERVRRHLGIGAQPVAAVATPTPAKPPAEPESPRTLSSKVTQEVPTRVDRELTEEEQSARRAEGFRLWRMQNGRG